MKRRPSGTWAPLPPPRYQAWEEASRGADLSQPLPYRPGDSYQVGQVIEHPRFGVGIVQGRKGHVLYVVFPDDTRRLVTGREK
ncbi:MAG: hypothetical protein DRI34_10075 [Deltaproteobacteria bacterium]|nr:MAG: hypothetical protein DRI34_10075 [Deltaproteobacteria bacterium]